MPNILIYKDQEKIDRAIELLNEFTPFVQSVYNAFQAIGITLTLAEIFTCLDATQTQARNFDAYLTTLVKDKLVEDVMPLSHSGIVVFSKEKLRELIELPDLTTIKSLMDNWSNYYNREIHLVRKELLQLSANVVSKVAGANTTIEAKYTHNTTTTKGDTITNKLKALCVALNDLPEAVTNYGLPGDIYRGRNPLIPGTALINGIYYPSVDFVRRHE